MLQASAMGAEFKLYPGDDGDRREFDFFPNGEGIAPWICVGESGAHDVNATFVWSSNFDLRESFTTSGVPDPLLGEIDTLRILIVARNRVGSVTMYALVDTLGANTEYISAGRSYGTAFDSGWFAWPLCPWTGAAWSRQNLVDLEFGVRSGVPGPADSAVVTQCNVTVIYTPDQIRFKRRRFSQAEHFRQVWKPTPPNSRFYCRGEE